MQKIFVALTALLWSISASAQVIHYSTQKSSYGSPAEWLTPSSQCHWTKAGVSGMGPNDPAHTHVDLTGPWIGELTSLVPLTLPFKITLHHTAGKVVGISGRWVTGFTLDGGATLAAMVGDPMGDRVWTGRLTIDPSIGATAGTLPKRGMTPLFMTATTRFDNGDVMTTSARRPIYSMLDPSAPEAPQGDGTGDRWSTGCTIQEKDGAPTLWGNMVVELLQTPPIFGVVSQDNRYKLQALSYTYAVPSNATGTPGVLEFRLDPDFHAGVPGTVIDSVIGDEPFHTFYVPDNMPDGTHKLMIRWAKPVPDLTRELDALLVMTYNVGAGGAPQGPNYPGFAFGRDSGTPGTVPTNGVPGQAPPPQTCQDPAATNIGGPLPCTYPPPPPGRCDGMVGLTGDAVINGITFVVTITGDGCTALAAVQP